MTTSRAIAAAGLVPRLRWGRSMLVRLAMVAAIATATLSMASVAAAASLPPHNEYVALGSSFASGPGLGTITDPVCGRSKNNYAQQVAEQLDLSLTDVSCWFATTADLIHGQTLPLGGVRPPQIDAITDETKLVTVTVGGNDTNYIASLVAYGCTDTTADPAAGVWTPLACASTTVDQEAIDQQLDTLPAQLAQLFDEIRERAPNARVLLVTYPQVVPITGSTCPQIALSREHAAFGRTIGARLELALVRAAAQSNVRLVDLFAPSTLHTACSRQPWVSGWEWGGFPTGTVAFHPTPTGMTAAAQRIIASLR
jgi:hypothetical protein